MKKLFGEFKEFISKGNVLDMAVGIIIGGAFTAIVNSLVQDILNPLINTILGGFSFDSMNIVVKWPWIKGINEAITTVNPTTFQEVLRKIFPNYIEYPVFCIGNFISAIITFFVTALALFLLIKGINNAKKLTEKKKAEAEAAAPTTKICPYCKSEINIEATKCPHCTSDQPAAAPAPAPAPAAPAAPQA